MSPSPTGKFSMGSRKGSLYNWTPPSTPSFRERYYLVSEPPQGRDAAVTLGFRMGAAPRGPACGAGRSSLAPPEVADSGLSLPCFGDILGGFRCFFFLAVSPPFWGPLDLVPGLAGSPGSLEWGSLDGSTTPAITLASDLLVLKLNLMYVSSR